MINNDIGIASNKRFTQTEFKLGNKNISTKQSAKIFNNYFIKSVYELITEQPKIESSIFSFRGSFPCEFWQIINIPITETEIVFTVSSIKNKTSCGYNSLSNKLLKLCGSQISKPLTNIYNKSSTSDICLDRPKYAIIKPCFKKSDKSQISNYIPIFLLTGFSKLFELLISHRLKYHLVSTNILANEQYGFHDNVSTESAIFKLTESIFRAWNNKEYITGLFCDLTKAFDCVIHEISFLKFEFYGVKRSILTLRRLMSYIYMEHPFLMFLDHTQRRSTVGRTPLDE